ncbi:hypothetical protein ACOMHN_057107 [Nucella lapillus]
MGIKSEEVAARKVWKIDVKEAKGGRSAWTKSPQITSTNNVPITNQLKRGLPWHTRNHQHKHPLPTATINTPTIPALHYSAAAHLRDVL